MIITKILAKVVSKVVKRSEMDFISEALGAENFGMRDLLHGLFYGSFPFLYIAVGIGEHPLVRWLGMPVRKVKQWVVPELNRPARQDRSATRSRVESIDEQGKRKVKIDFADTYHGKVLTLESARQLVMVQEDVNLPNLEPIIPYARARDLILRNPDHIVALECPCRSARPDPCLPLDVCLVVGEPFASYIQEHQPKRSRWITQEEAVAILKAEDERGHVHHAFFKDAMLGRFYAICNCCSCCCGAMQMQRSGMPMLASSGYVCVVDEDLCIGCGTCAEYCQFEALDASGITSQVNFERCMGCGVCVNQCPQEALKLQLDVRKGLPLEIVELMGAVQ